MTPENEEVYSIWRDLVVRFGVSGVQVHDARLVAVMVLNEISAILTFDVNDFRRYSPLPIDSIHPDETN